MTINEEDVKRYCDAKKCKDCIGWHKYCDAECCKVITIGIDPKQLERTQGNYLLVKVGRELSPSDQYYYKLHDVRYTRGTLRFRKDRIHVIGKKVLYLHKCELLDENNLCKGHPNKKPEICRVFTLDTATDEDKNFLMTDNCLYKYKEKGGN